MNSTQYRPILPQSPPPRTTKMQPQTTALTLSVLVLLTFSATTTNGHNITKILASHPSLSLFNQYLSLTHLAAEINRRETITVLALDNAAMQSLLSKQLSLYTLRNVLSMHVLVDYFGAKKLHQITNGSTLTSSLFQASGSAPGSSGYVNMTDLNGGRVAFGPEDNGGTLDAFFVKSIYEMPYNISVIEISQALNSAEAEAPTAAPTLNLTAIMSKQGCQAFLNLLISSGALSVFEQAVDGGLTVFCPPDAAINSFMPKYNNLTASQKESLQLYHGVPVYQPLQTLKSNNGVMNTLATDGASKYDFTVQNDGENVNLETKVDTASITSTLKDEEPLIVYKIDKVLMPGELFKAAPTKKASAPKGASADGPSADGPASDSTIAADHNTGVRLMHGSTLTMCLGVILFLI